MSKSLSNLPRPERRQVINRRVVKRIDEVTPDGLKDWDPIIEIIRGPTDAFVDATDQWLDSDTPESRADLQRAADALVRAWKEAGQRFRALKQRGPEVPA